MTNELNLLRDGFLYWHRGLCVPEFVSSNRVGRPVQWGPAGVSLDYVRVGLPSRTSWEILESVGVAVVFFS